MDINIYMNYTGQAYVYEKRRTKVLDQNKSRLRPGNKSNKD